MLLITGSSGQLGQELAPLFPEAVMPTSSDLDITDAAAVDAFVRKHNVDAIINCAAYTAVDRAEDERVLAENVNIKGPLNLAKTGAKIIHISTDYVFDGKHFRPYIETDSPNPCSVYGKTKLGGEWAVMKHSNTAVVLRTSWLYSRNGHNFLKTMLSLGSEKDNLDVVFDQVGTPTCAADLAKAIFDIFPQIKSGQKEIYHFSNEGVCSWYDFAVEIMSMSGLGCVVNPIESKDFPTRSTRPFYSVLNKAKIKKTFGVKIPYWKESLRKCIDQF